MTRKIPTNYAEARDLADEARDRAFARVDIQRRLETRHREMEEARSRAAQRDTTVPFDVAVDRRLRDDPRYKAAVADNRWYIDYATMYAQGEILDRLHDIGCLLTPKEEHRATSVAQVLRPNPRVPRSDRA